MLLRIDLIEEFFATFRFEGECVLIITDKDISFILILGIMMANSFLLLIILSFFLLSCGDGHHLDVGHVSFMPAICSQEYLLVPEIQMVNYDNAGNLVLKNNSANQSTIDVISSSWTVTDAIDIGPGCGGGGDPGDCIYSGTSPRLQEGEEINLNGFLRQNDFYVTLTVKDVCGNQASTSFLFGTVELSEESYYIPNIIISHSGTTISLKEDFTVFATPPAPTFNSDNFGIDWDGDGSYDVINSTTKEENYNFTSSGLHKIKMYSESLLLTSFILTPSDFLFKEIVYNKP